MLSLSLALTLMLSFFIVNGRERAGTDDRQEREGDAKIRGKGEWS